MIKTLGEWLEMIHYLRIEDKHIPNEAIRKLEMHDLITRPDCGSRWVVTFEGRRVMEESVLETIRARRAL